MKIRKILGTVISLAIAASMFSACGAKPDSGSNGGAADNGGAPASSSGELIKVGIINNDPNESGYRTANDAAMRATFTEENGYKATFYNNNDASQQIAEAQQMVQNEVDFLLLSPASTTGWDTVLKDAQAAGITHGVDGDVIVMGFDCNK